MSNELSPGLVLIEAGPSFTRAVPLEGLSYDERAGVRLVGRYAAGAELKPGRLVSLVGGILLHTTGATIGSVVGVALARPRYPVWDQGELVQVLRGGQVTVEGVLGGDFDRAVVIDGGTFVAAEGPGAVLVPRAIYTRRGVDLNL